MAIFAIERPELTEEQKRLLVRVEGARSIEVFPGNLDEFERLKMRRFNIIDTGRPEKFVDGYRTSHSRELEDALSINDGRVRIVKAFIFRARISSNLFHYIDEACLRAYDLGADALIHYESNRDYTRGVPVKEVTDQLSFKVA